MKGAFILTALAILYCVCADECDPYQPRQPRGFLKCRDKVFRRSPLLVDAVTKCYIVGKPILDQNLACLYRQLGFFSDNGNNITAIRNLIHTDFPGYADQIFSGVNDCQKRVWIPNM